MGPGRGRGVRKLGPVKRNVRTRNLEGMQSLASVLTSFFLDTRNSQRHLVTATEFYTLLTGPSGCSLAGLHKTIWRKRIDFSNLKGGKNNGQWT